MKRHLTGIKLACSACTLASSIALGVANISKAAAADYQPQLDQPGKDVVWVPTPDALVNTMLDLARLKPGDHLIDLGSGDGRLVIAAAKRGARAHGIEYDGKLVVYARRAAQQAGVADKATFAKADLFASDFSQATVVTLFLGPELNRKLLPKLLDLKPGTRIVSNTHPIGDWPADETAQSRDDDKSVYYRTSLLWIVPAKVAGVWQSAQGQLTLTQRYQKLDGSFQADDKTVPAVILANAVLRGEQLAFNAGGAHYAGVVKGKVIEGIVSRGNITQPWRAIRALSSK